MMASKTVYVAGPYSKGDVALNVRYALEVAEALIDKGFTPYIPHLTHFWHLVFPHDIEFWYAYDLEWLAKCDALLRLTGESIGADKEVRFAQDHGIPVFHYYKDLAKHFPAE